VLIASLWIAAASAASWSVEPDGSGDFPTLESAVASASSGDTLVLGAGTFSEAIEIGEKALNIEGVSSEETILDASGLWQVAITTSGDLTISGLQIQNSDGPGIAATASSVSLSDVHFYQTGSDTEVGGAVAMSGGDLTLQNVTIEEGTATRGMIFLSNDAWLTASDSTFFGAETSMGGAIYVSSGTSELTLTSCDFSENYAVDGGDDSGGGALYLEAGSTVTVTDSSFYANMTESAHGSAIYMNGATLNMTGGSIELNMATNYDTAYTSGAVYASGSLLTVDGTEIKDNTGYYGGGFYLVDSTEATFADASIEGNWGYYGGGVYAYHASVHDTDGIWAGNIGYSGGGGLYSWVVDDVVFSGTTFEDNEATYGHGGGAYVYVPAEEMTFENVDFIDNYAYNRGGGMLAYSIYYGGQITGCNFEGNVAEWSGGGAISAHYYTDLVISQSTFTENETEVDGGAIDFYYSTGVIRESSFTANRSLGGQGGAVRSYCSGCNSGPITIAFSDFSSNSAEYHGGAISSVYDTLQITDSTFHVNDTGSQGMGGGLYSGLNTSITVLRNRFSGNNAGYGGAIYSDSPEGNNEQLAHNLLVENTADIGGGIVFIDNDIAEVQHNAFVGNSAVQNGANVVLFNTGVNFEHNVFAFSPAGAGVHSYDTESGESSSFAYNAFYDIPDGVAGGELSSTTLINDTSLAAMDPLFVAYTPDGDPENDNFVLLRDSPLIDAGDPKSMDVDKSRADIGAWGGPDLIVEDKDEDGYTSWIDCHDDNADAHPGATEAWYDGVNGDCLSGSDYDADQDGYDAEDHGGVDCDDTNAALTQNCAPGQDDDEEGESDGCGCASVSPPTGWAWSGLLVAGLLVGRRRRA